MTKKTFRALLVFLMVICLVLPHVVIAQETSSGADKSLEYLAGVVSMVKDRYNYEVTEQHLIEGAVKGLIGNDGFEVYKDQEKNMALLGSVMQMLREENGGRVSEQQLIEGALKGIFDSMDDYTVYFTMEEAQSFLSSTSGNYEGIGVLIEKIGDYVVITKVFNTSPAQKAGILPGDKIAEVDGKNVVGASPEEVGSLVKGKSGSKVNIGVIRDGMEAIRYFEMSRAAVKVNPVEYEIRNGIGYIRIDMFNSNTNQFIKEALKEMDKRKIAKIVLDLRDNPGGYVDQAVEVARRFVPQGLITRLDFKSESERDVEYLSYLKNTKYKLVVLVNEMSASASEILAGAIQDKKSGVLVGTNTFGKGRVQSIIPIITPEASEKYKKRVGKTIVDAYRLYTKHGVFVRDEEVLGWCKITTGEYKTPNGRMIDGSGLEPDIKVDNYVPVNGIDVNNIRKLSAKSVLKLGSESVDVYNAEKILKISGYDVDTPDMKLDEKTYNAIMQFQKDSKIKVSGNLTTTTQVLLNRKLGNMLIKIDKQYAKAVEVLKRQ